MEQGLNADHFLGQEDDEKAPAKQGEAGHDKGQPAAPSEATGIFGVAPQATGRTMPGDVGPIAPASGIGTPLPVVHSVVFKADSSRAEQTDELLNLLRSAPAPAPVAVPPQPAAAPSSGGFTQLLRALNFDQPQAQPKGPVATAMPERPLPKPVEEPVRAAAPHLEQVTSFLPQAPPAATVPAAASVQATPGSFTQMFQALQPKPVEAVPPAPTSRMEATDSNSPAQRGGSKPPPPPAAAPGSFTQMFGALGAVPEQAVAMPEKVVDVEPPPFPPAAPAGSFTQMFQALRSSGAEVAKPEIAVASTPSIAETPAAAPGSFTQMFRSLEAVPEKATEVEPSNVSSAPSESFTQMFQAVSPPSAQASKVENAPVVAPTSVPAAAASHVGEPAQPVPGSFTQMFQAVSSPTVEPPKEPAGSFTRMFSIPATEPAPKSYEPARELSSPDGGPIRSSGAAGNSDASQMFAVYRPPLETPRAQPTAAPAESMQRPAQPTPASSGGLTQLLNALNQPAQTPRPYVPPVSVPQPVAQEPGFFTAMYETLGGEAAAPGPPPSIPTKQGFAPPATAGKDATQAFHLPPAAAPPVLAAPLQSGPSEYTRIIDASLLREAALRGSSTGTPAAPEGQSPAATPAAPQWAMPAAPKMPGIPTMPTPPKAPEMKLPEAPKMAAPGAGQMQQYLPLLLILIIFLLLAILVAVIFLMKK